MKSKLAILTLLVGGALVSVALASGGDDSIDEVADLQAEAKRATPVVGDPVPACPSEEISAELIRRDIDFGPCMPFLDGTPKVEREAALEQAGNYSPEAEPATGRNCETEIYRTVDGGIEARFPCGSEMIKPESYADAYSRFGETACFTFQFKLESDEIQTRRFCEGQDPEGEVVR